jgi:DNA-directed DNA polymerase III PolC
MYLNIHTSLSFKYGTLSPEDIFIECQRLGITKLALTEINNTASYIEMLRIIDERKDEYHLDLVVGMEFREDHHLRFIALAKNNAGFEEINRYRSYLNEKQQPVPQRAPAFDHVFVIYPYEEEADVAALRTFEFMGVRTSQASRFQFAPPAPGWEEKLVVLHPVTFKDKTTHNIHRLLRAIDTNSLLSKLAPNMQAHPDEVMIEEVKLIEKFQHMPSIVLNTQKLLDECTFMMDLGPDKNKANITGSDESDWNMLVTSAWEGFHRRYDPSNALYRARLQRELDVIRMKRFTTYYLIAFDLVTFADEQGYDHVGRGSGANSMVAFCLGITDVDPIELDLYFERFLNEERTSPPDFDIDFSWKDRDAIYEYLFKRYRHDHVCLLGTHVTFQHRSIVRELGKVFGLPRQEIDQLVDYPEQNKNRDHIAELIFRYAEIMTRIPSNLSIHAGGVLITEKPIYAYTATDLPPKGLPVSHFEMHNAEDLGIFKIDVLSQRGLGHLKETVRMVKKNRNVEVDIHRFNDFKTDEKVRELLRSSRAIGCFYVESPAMRMLLGKLRCEDYITLVAASSIIRPGVASSGMMRAYIERFHAVRNGKTYESIHPAMDELMRETFGVMVYQEDVIKVAHHFAGLTLTEADVLRRGMSGKYRSRREFDRVKSRFFENCSKKGYSEKVTNRVWFEIESFSGYSFAKGHSASYAVESYQSLFLKAHYPLEFMVGVINNFGGFYKTEFYFHEARMSGGVIEPPCINHSEQLTVINGQTLYVGFIHLKSLEKKLAPAIAPEREKNGPYKSLNDFLRRLAPGLEQVRILIRVGAFRFTGKNKQKLLWEAMLYYSQAAARMPATEELFDTEPTEYPLPDFQINEIEDAFDEIELIGFPLNDPFRLLPSTDVGDAYAGDLMARKGKPVTMVGYVVTTKDTSTKGGLLMHFGTFIDSRGEAFDTVHFPDIAKRFPFRGRGFYKITGKVVDDFGIAVVEVARMEKLPMVHKRQFEPEMPSRTPSF